MQVKEGISLVPGVAPQRRTYVRGDIIDNPRCFE